MQIITNPDKPIKLSAEEILILALTFKPKQKGIK